MTEDSKDRGTEPEATTGAGTPAGSTAQPETGAAAAVQPSSPLQPDAPAAPRTPAAQGDTALPAQGEASLPSRAVTQPESPNVTAEAAQPFDGFANAAGQQPHPAENHGWARPQPHGAVPAGYSGGPATEQLPAGTAQFPTGTGQFPPYGQAYSASGAGYAQGGHQPTEPIFGGPGGPGQPGGPDLAYSGAPAPKRPVRTGLIAGAVALALVSGGIGGTVGALATRSDNGSSVTNALNAPVQGKTVANAPEGSVQAVAQKVLPSVVMIQVAGSKAEGEGSGVVLSSDGLILTNNHVANGAGPNAKMQVAFSDGSTASATLIGADPVSDIAVIKVAGKSGLTPIDLGSSANLQVGESVVAVGSPLGLAGTVTTGIVSSLNRPVSTSGESGSQGAVISAIQTDAAINPGNSGGALVDMSGKLIGINTAIATLGTQEAAGSQSGSIGLGFAIPVDQARRVADQLIKNGKATYAQIGVKVRAQDDVNGARVLEVTPDGPAAKAGIPNNAIVTKLDDQVVDSGNALIAAVRSHQPGDKVKLTYTDEQGKNAKTVEVTLGEAAAEGGR
ncbi:trypsin-like peptidase domain-containing protein [Nocardia sp. NPDC051030]|uniref:trypsin-like peptidase domain-containing protein n=1 Tax=Nocardia sp. NPDC051030 TaxID=3155162 RepID=UPI0034427613